MKSLDRIAILSPCGLRDATGIARGCVGRVFGNKIELRHDGSILKVVMVVRDQDVKGINTIVTALWKLEA